MAVALVPASDQAIFDNISLVRIGACLDDRQECIKMVSTVWTACLCRWFDQCAITHHCREQALDHAVDGVTWHCPVKACKKRFSIITWQSSCGIRDLKNILPLHLAWTKVTQQNSSTLLYELNGKKKSKKWHFKSHK